MVVSRNGRALAYSIGAWLLRLSLLAFVPAAGCSGDDDGGVPGARAGAGGAAGSAGVGGVASGIAGESGGAGGPGDTGGSGDAGGTSGGAGVAGDTAGAGTAGDGVAGQAGDGGATSEFCPGARWRPVSFAAPETLPDLEDVPLPDVPSFSEVVAAGDGYEHSVRLDVCEADDGTLSLGAVLHAPGGFAPTLYRPDPAVSSVQQSFVEIDGGMVEELRVPPSDFIVEGLADALDGDYDGFSVRIRYEYGAIIGGADGLVVYGDANLDAASVSYNSIYLVAGTLVPGDVFADLSCAFGEQPFETSFSLDTATFDLEACTFYGVGETIGYRITRMGVEDTNSILTEPERARHEFDGEASVNSVLTYQWNHHNACDSFHLALPHADYAATAAASAGCGETVPDAPPRDIEDEDGLKYRIRYHDGEWVDGVNPDCFHYLFCGEE